jgi:HK97 family phage major capsid protein
MTTTPQLVEGSTALDAGQVEAVASPEATETDEDRLTRRIAEQRQAIAVGELDDGPAARAHLAFLIERRDQLRGGVERRVITQHERRDAPARTEPRPTAPASVGDALRALVASLPAGVALHDIEGLSDVERRQLAPLLAPADAPFSTTRHEPTRRPANPYVLGREDRMTDWARERQPQEYDRFGHLDLGKLMRGMATGSWTDAAEERAALAEGATGTGGAFIPTPLSVDVVDLARNQARVLQAGAQVMPMETSTLKLPRWATDPTPGWLSEAGTVTESEPTVDSITLTAQMLTFLVKASRQVLEDSGPDMTSELRANMAKVIALELDRVALRGTGTPPQPHGILGTAGITSTTLGAGNGLSLGTQVSGIAPTWDFAVDAVQACAANNFTANAVIMSPRTLNGLYKCKDSQGRYLEPPDQFDVTDPNDDRVARVVPLPSNQVPINLTVGSSVDCSEAYTAQWDRLAIGIRSQFTLMLSERYSDVLQYGFIVGLRADIALLRPGAFAVTLGIRV